MANTSIGSAVGAKPAPNLLEDQRRIRNLLRRVPFAKGGPILRIPEPERSGLISSELQAAILRFQVQNVPAQFRDGRIDPTGVTLRTMNALAVADPTDGDLIVIDKTTDVLVHIVGEANPARGGQEVPDDEGQDGVGIPSTTRFNNMVNTEEYLRFHNRLQHRMIRGLAPANRIQEIANWVAENFDPRGNVCIVGTSSGGPNILQLGALLAKQNVRIHYAGICDGAFADSNPIRRQAAFAAFVSENFFQTRGDAIDPRQEFHGRIDSFKTNIDFTADPEFLARQAELELKLRALQNPSFHRQDAINDFHRMAVAKGYRQAKSTILSLLAP
jgi:hypothetical protein